MTTTKQVIGFESNPYKQINRDILTEILQEKIGNLPSTIGASLCGASAEFEKQFTQTMPNSKVFCIEHNKETAAKAQNFLPPQCMMVVGDWKKTINQLTLKNQLDWMWADFCCNPTEKNVQIAINDIRDRHPKVYAVTFDLGCRGIAGGANAAQENLSTALYSGRWGYYWSEAQNCMALGRRPNDKSKAAYKAAKRGTEGLIQMVIKAIGVETNYIPHTVVYYGGGKNKENPSVPMLTMIYCQDDQYKIGKKHWSWSRPFGYEGIKFVNLFKVKKGQTTLEQAMNEQGDRIKSITMVEAGKKAWETRRANAKKRKKSEAAKKAWETRRANA